MWFKFTKHAKLRLRMYFPGLDVGSANALICKNIMNLKLDSVRGTYFIFTDVSTFVLSPILSVVTVYTQKEQYPRLLVDDVPERKIKQLLLYKDKNDFKGEIGLNLPRTRDRVGQ